MSQAPVLEAPTADPSDLDRQALVGPNGTKPGPVRPGRVAMTRCGYCAFGNNHGSCPGGVRNGNGSIHQCTCRETPRCGQLRCTDCNNREEGTVGSDWRCLDKDDCAAAQERVALANPVVQAVRRIHAEHGKYPAGASATHGGVEAPEKAPRSRKAPSAGGKPCLCECGETTGGGTFRPGHDSKYLNRLVAEPGDSSRTLAYAVSEAFGKKYEKRVGN